MTSSECDLDRPEISAEEEVSTEEACRDLCDAYAEIGLGCYFAGWLAPFLLNVLFIKSKALKHNLKKNIFRRGSARNKILSSANPTLYAGVLLNLLYYFKILGLRKYNLFLL